MLAVFEGGAWGESNPCKEVYAANIWRKKWYYHWPVFLFGCFKYHTSSVGPSHCYSGPLLIIGPNSQLGIVLVAMVTGTGLQHCCLNHHHCDCDHHWDHHLIWPNSRLEILLVAMLTGTGLACLQVNDSQTYLLALWLQACQTVWKTSSQAPSYASPKLSPTHWLRGVKCRATSVAKNLF